MKRLAAEIKMRGTSARRLSLDAGLSDDVCGMLIRGSYRPRPSARSLKMLALALDLPLSEAPRLLDEVELVIVDRDAEAGES